MNNLLCSMHRTVAAMLAAAALAMAAAPPDAEIRKILIERVDVRKQAIGMVVGIADSSGRRIVAYGATAKEGGRSIDGDTLFEIGSITKVFTGELLADAIARGTVKLDDPVAKYLSADVKVPERGGRQITLHDLTSHRSGLPRLPDNLKPKDMLNPYASFTEADLYAFLNGHTLRRDPGAEFEYSNLGAGLLGHVLARAAGTSYEALVKDRILTPLKMTSTAITLSPELAARMSSGHNQTLAAVPGWDLPTLAGAGALRSTANDMLKFLAAHAGLDQSGLSAVMASMSASRRPAMGPSQIGFGWIIEKLGSDSEMIWHNGGTGGFQSFAGFDPKSRTAVVVLSNAQKMPGIDDIGRHLLDPSRPLIPAPKQREKVPFDPKKFDAFTGNYQLRPNFVLAVTREGDRFFTQATGQGKIEVFAMSERVFFPTVVDAELEFTVDATGRATSVTLRQNGAVIEGRRVE